MTDGTVNGIERYFLEQKVARLHELRAKLAGKIGLEEAIDLSRWFAAVRDIGCPNCGLDFASSPPELNVYPHWIGDCKSDD